MHGRVFPKVPRPSAARVPRGTLSRAFLASATLHATVLGAGLLLGLWTAVGRPPARAFTATFAPPQSLAVAPREREAMDPSEPEGPAEPALRESEVWSQATPSSDVLESPEPEPARRSVDWVAARPFAIGTLGAPEEPVLLELPPLATAARIYHVAYVVPPAAPVISEPVPLEVPPPAYPRLARRASEEGSVLCRLALDRDGGVARVVVVESSGFDRLDEAARLALASWRFTPRRENGLAVEASVLHRVTFRLSEG